MTVDDDDDDDDDAVTLETCHIIRMFLNKPL